jgi:hypothetical protein
LRVACSESRPRAPSGGSGRSRGVALVGRPSLRLGRGGGRKCRTVEPWSGLLAARALAARALAARALAARALAACALAARALAALQQPCAAV